MIRFSTALKVTAVSAALLLAACTTKPQAESTPPPPAPPPPAAAAPAPVTSSILPGSIQDFRTNVGDTIHFDFDKYSIRDEDRTVLQRQAQWLARYPQVRVTVEGNCDERGTREYNLALGARRANAEKEYLVSLGVDPSRVDTISYGKERPVCTESSEDCWAQNRRGVTDITSGAASS